MSETVAFVGSVGGVGTTRVTLGCAELLAANGRDTAVLDAAYGTQGLADRTAGRIAPDMTQLCLGEVPLGEGLIDRSLQGGGRLAVCPARAPFSRLAEAKSPDAAQRFEARIAEAARQFEYVLIDTPPIAANQAVAAVTGAETVAVVSDDERAEASIPRTADRLADIGIDEFSAIVTHTASHPDADAAVPTLETEPPVIGETATAHNAFCDVLETTVGLSIEPETTDGLLSGLSFK
jgi:septum site-determining protein MinD